MILSSIPDWNAQGVLSPINVLDPTAVDRSPYTVTLADFVQRFGSSPARREILRGFLEYRTELHR